MTRQPSHQQRSQCRVQIICLFLTMVLAPSIGCEPPEVPRLEPLQRESTEPESTAIVPLETPSQDWTLPGALPLENWYIQYLAGKRVGIISTRVSEGEAGTIRIQQSGKFDLVSADNQSMPYETELVSLEHPNGRIANFTETTTLADASTTISGSLSKDILRLTTTIGEETKKKGIKWAEGTWGTLGIQSMLLAKPMQPNELRTCQVLVPKLGRIVPVELSAGQPELTNLPGGETPELIPVDAVMKVGDDVNHSRNWIDEQGVIHKTITLGSVMVSTFRAPDAMAIKIAEEMEFATLMDNRVRFEGPKPAATLERVDYMAEGSDVDLYSLWAQDARQSVKSLTAFRSRIVIRDVRSADLSTAGTQDQPTPQDVAPAPLLEVDHPTIDTLADSLLASIPEQSGHARFLALADALAEHIQSTPTSAVISTALSTAREQSGDFQDQALLLAAIYRHLGYPARIAIGLRLDRPSSQFRYYMWTEVWSDDRWLPIDAESGAMIDVTYLKMRHTDLQSDAIHRFILPIFESMQNYSLRITSAD